MPIDVAKERAGIDLNRTTIARWMLKMGDLVKPLVNLMHEDLLATPVLHMDETAVQVLGEPERPPEARSYMWCMARQGTQLIIYFQYYPTRSKSAALDLLQDYKGTLICDGYKVYDSVGRSLECKVAACQRFRDGLHAVITAHTSLGFLLRIVNSCLEL